VFASAPKCQKEAGPLTDHGVCQAASNSGRNEGGSRGEMAFGDTRSARILLVASCGLRVVQQGGINRLGR
jgi:hypothetical protein